MSKPLALFAALFLAAAAVAAPQTLFEDRLDAGLAAAGAPHHWRPYKTTVNGQDGTISAITLDGRKAVRLTDDGPGEIGFFRTFKVEPGSYLRASIDAALPPGAAASDAFKLQLTFRRPKLTNQTTPLTPGGAKFETFRNAVQVPEGADELFVYLYSHKNPVGDIAVSNFKLEADSAPFKAAAVPLGPRGGKIEAQAAALNPETAVVVPQSNFGGGHGVSLKPGVAANLKTAGAEPDLVFDVRGLRPGRYVLTTHAATDAQGAEAMRKAGSKFASMYAKYRIGERRPTERVIFVPWARPDSSVQHAGIFEFTAQDRTVGLWLPAGLRLDYLQIRPYVPPAVPEAVRNYVPKAVPPATRPRLWVNAETLPQLRKNLTHPENQPFWNRVKAAAEKPFEFKFDPDAEVKFNAGLERAAFTKAFHHLMTGEKKIGREAVQLTCDYLARVEFGNLLDITREIGAAIYSAACVYDWCYELMSKEERDLIRANLLRLCDDMEIGWPPFKQSIVNGHGNEAQVNRDLLSMSIAIYDEDPVPYRYCAYRILEELAPMRAFEYQSSRHNQGVGYGSYRFTWDMHAAHLFRRMLNRPVFDDNLKTVYKFWQYMRMPNGSMFRDGDGITGDGRYWTSPLLTLLCYSYNADPVIKGEFFRQGGDAFNAPVLFLLLNDPALPAERSLASLPLTHDFGPILGSMVARTGWRIGHNSPDAAVEFKGGGYHAGNHQFADAGSFQIYYRGLLAAKLGLYHFYGTPYDMNFNKRSIAQPMLLVRDPNEKFLSTPANDGGSRFLQSHPRSPAEAKENPLFHYGKKRSGSFGPVALKPCFSYFSADLTGAYSDKISAYVRSFCFLNLGLPEHPAAVIISDDVTAASADFPKYWQINTLKPPKLTGTGAELYSEEKGRQGKLHVNMVVPAEPDRTVQLLSGKEANSVFGLYYTPPRPAAPEANGHRIMFSPKKAAKRDRFLVVMQIADRNADPLPVTTRENEANDVVVLADRVVSLARGTALLERAFAIQVPAGRDSYQVLAAGLAPGDWQIAGKDFAPLNVTVEAGKNTAFFLAPAGEYTVSPGRHPAGKPQAWGDDAPVPPGMSELPPGSVTVDNRKLEAPPIRRNRQGALLPAAEIFRALKCAVTDRDGVLTVEFKQRKVIFQNHSRDFTVDGVQVRMPQSAIRDRQHWFLPEQAVSTLLAGIGYELVLDDIGESASIFSSGRQLPAKILLVDSNTNPDQAKLREMLADRPDKGGTYWDGQGKDTWIRMVFSEPLTLEGVGIEFLSGGSRRASFSIELSEDGNTWHRVFDGESSGSANGLEVFRFPARKANQLRFNGYGNSANDWNSIVTFKPIEKP